MDKSIITNIELTSPPLPTPVITIFVVVQSTEFDDSDVLGGGKGCILNLMQLTSTSLL